MSPISKKVPPHRWAVIFDVDGTMVDNSSYHEMAWIELGRRHNIAIDHRFYMDNIHSRSNIHVAHDVFAEMVGLEKGLLFGVEKSAIYRQLYRRHLREIPGFTKLLRSLRSQGIACCAASNSPRANIDMVIEELAIQDCISYIVDNSMVKKGKPSPEMFLAAAAALGVASCNCVVVEDSVSGFKAADNAGMSYIAITVGANAKDLPFAATARAVHHDFTTVTVEQLRGCAGF